MPPPVFSEAPPPLPSSASSPKSLILFLAALFFFFFASCCHAYSSSPPPHIQSASNSNSAYAETSPTCTVSAFCGKTNISYPFWLSHDQQQPSFHCGYDGLQLYCQNNNQTILRLGGDNYTVTGIDYATHTLYLADTDVLGKQCPRVRHNLTVSGQSMFGYDHEYDTNLTFFFNCTPDIGLPSNEIACLPRSGANRSYVFSELVQYPTRLSAPGVCADIVVAAVLLQQLPPPKGTNITKSFDQALQQGFQLTWPKTSSGDCAKCEISGGRCGLNQTTSSSLVFTCFCANGVLKFPDCKKNLLCASLLIFHLLASTAPLAATLQQEDCKPTVCGELSVKYPFSLNGQQPPECGYPSFNITCIRNKTAVVNFFGNNYYVNNIFYDNQSLVLSAAQFVDDPCRLPYFNLTYDIYPLSIDPSNKRVVFFLNCSSPLPAGYKEITCAPYGRPAYYGGEYEDRPSFAGPGGCVNVIVPVVGYSNTSRDVDYEIPLSDGWLMNWTLQDCSACYNSGGACGYQNSSASFVCICNDRIHKGTCKNNKRKITTIGIAAAAAGIFLLALITVLLFRKYKKKQKSASSKSLMQDVSFGTNTNKDSEMSSVNFQTRVFTYKELLEATNSFHASRELGDGGFGAVYKGELKDGRIVAIKRLYQNSYRRVEQFVNEVGILSQLHHPNLVNLYGCTSHHSSELLLVYEFVSNGTIADHLHGSRATEALLTWPMRLNIAIETADALRYLHAVEPPIIHRDIKSNNILLDGSFHVKVGDFGLSRLFPDNVTHVSTAPQGTPGYLDPEYHQCYQLTDKSDVYSFGVVLVELISSKPAVDITRHRSEINLANMAINRIQNGEIDQLADPNIGYNSNRAVRKMMTMAAELAFRCLQTDGDMRPPMKEVLEVLRAIEIEGYNIEKERDVGARTRDDSGLLKNVPPFSPDTVMHEWASRSTTPNTSV